LLYYPNSDGEGLGLALATVRFVAFTLKAGPTTPGE
jgi:hypothetical protein